MKGQGYRKRKEKEQAHRKMKEKEQGNRKMKEKEQGNSRRKKSKENVIVHRFSFVTPFRPMQRKKRHIFSSQRNQKKFRILFSF